MMDERDVGVVLFTYNRPDHTALVLQGLATTGVRHLYVYQDGLRPGHDATAHAAVTALISSVTFADVTFRKSDANKGLARSLLAGVTEVLSEKPAIVVLEDDCVPSPHLLSFMRTCLARFQDDPRVFSISGYALPSFPATYAYDVCFSPLSSSWGWATWRDRWAKFDTTAEGWQKVETDPLTKAAFDRPGSLFSGMLLQQMRGHLDSWAIRWYFSHFRHDAVAVWPIRSHIQNIGMDGTGVHCVRSTDFDTELAQSFDPAQLRVPPTLSFDWAIARAFRRHYDTYSPARLWKLVKHRENWPALFKRLRRLVLPTAEGGKHA